MREIIVIFGKQGSGKTSLAKEVMLGRKRLFVFDTLKEYKVGLVTDDLITVLNFTEEHQHSIFRISYAPEIEEKRAFDYICEVVYSLGNLTFLIEEVDCFCSANKTPVTFSKIIRYGRHNNISIITTARRTADVPRLLTSQATDFFIFSHHEPRDIKYFSDLFTPGIADKIRRLKKLEYLHLKPEKEKEKTGKLKFK